MNLRNRIIATFGATALLASTVVGVGAVQAGPSESAVVNVSVKNDDGGTTSAIIDVTTPFSAADYSLTQDDLSEGALQVTATDTRGTAAGWTVKLKATDFSGTYQGNVIAVDNLDLTPGAAARAVGVGEIPTTTSALTPVRKDMQTLWTAAEGQGDGIFTLPLDGDLTVPAGTLVDTYTSTVTVEITGAAPGDQNP